MDYMLSYLALLPAYDQRGPAAVQVVEVLRQMPQRDLLAEAINFNAMGALEVAALGRVLRCAPEALGFRV